jgi:hypothetical protein
MAQIVVSHHTEVMHTVIHSLISETPHDYQRLVHLSTENEGPTTSVLLFSGRRVGRTEREPQSPPFPGTQFTEVGAAATPLPAVYPGSFG